MAEWSTVESHLKQHGVEYTRTNVGGSNAHKIEASIEVMGQRRAATVFSSAGDDRFKPDDLRAFFKELGIGPPSWL